MIPKHAIGSMKYPKITHGDDSVEFIMPLTYNVYYLPGDINKILHPYDVRKVNIKGIGKVIEAIFVSIQPALSNMVAQFIKMASEFNERIQKEKIIGFTKLDTPADITIQELFDSIQKEFRETKDICDKAPLQRPIKIIKAVKVNKSVNKIIYHHIRSNC